MPIQLHNDHGNITLRELQAKQAEGFSVMKTPHVGNQHLSNLVCATLGFHLHMVSFTSGERDKNFHPHLRIQGGQQHQLSCPTQWTPFARTSCGSSLQEYHQGAVQQRFPRLRVTTDVQLLQDNQELAQRVLEVATQTISRLWYRMVTADGDVYNVSNGNVPAHNKILSEVFGFSSATHGWVVPNRAYILYDSIVQSLESGRDVIYHLSGPQMVGYIGKQIKSVSKAYDAFREQYPSYGLPEVLHLYVVPVAAARFAAHVSTATHLDEVIRVVQWYESLENQEKRFAAERFEEIVGAFPQFFTPIEEGTFLSQYDLGSADDLCVSQWMMDTPLTRVQKMHSLFVRHADSSVEA